MTTNEVRALGVACVLVLGILLGIAIGRAQIAQETLTPSGQGVAVCAPART